VGAPRYLFLNADGFNEEAPRLRRVVTARVLTAIPANTDVAGPASTANLDTNLGDLSQGEFLENYDISLNGNGLNNGVNLAANCDVYPGTSLAAGQLRFAQRLGVGDHITVIVWVV
jgi:hypothetical protein